MSIRLLKSTFTVGLMTSVSRVFGLIRDIVIARLFGAGLGVDVFLVAFRIPNFLRRLFAEGGFSQAFVPVLAEYKAERSEAELKALVDQTAAVLGLALFLITAAGIVLSPILISVFAPGFISAPEKHALAGDLLRITFPYLLFISLTAFAGGILNTFKQFAVPAFTPALLNLSLIGCAIWLAPLLETPVKALAWGVLIAGVAQLLLQLPFLWKLRLLPRPGLNRDRAGVKRILKLMLPILFAVSIVQINLLIDTLIASFLATGSISWLYFSDRLVEFPLGVFGIALATVILPHLSEQHARGRARGFSEMLDWALRWVFLIALPAALGLALLARPLLTTLFQYDEFTPYDVEMAGRSLMAYAAGLPAFVLIKVLAAGFFSRQDTKTPVRIGAFAMLANILLNLALVGPLAHAGLALATSLSACLQAFLLYRLLKRDRVYQPGRGWPAFMGRIMLGLAGLGAIVLAGAGDPLPWLDWDAWRRGLSLLLLVALGMAGYFSLLWGLGLRFGRLTRPAEPL